MQYHPIPFRSEDCSTQLTCSICLNIPLDPVLTPSCEHLFCRDCLGQHIQANGHTCPNCRMPAHGLRNVQPGSIVYRIWSETKVKCAHCSRGCPWSGSIVDFEKHMRACKLDESSRKDREEKKRLMAECRTLRSQVTTLEHRLQSVQDQLVATEDNLNAAQRKAQWWQNECEAAKEELTKLQQHLKGKVLVPWLFRGEYYFDRNTVVQLAQLVSRRIDDPPAIIDTNRIYNCVRSCYQGLERGYRDNPWNYRTKIQMLLSTCLVSSWFTENQRQSFQRWRVDQGWD